MRGAEVLRKEEEGEEDPPPYPAPHLMDHALVAIHSELERTPALPPPLSQQSSGSRGLPSTPPLPAGRAEWSKLTPPLCRTALLSKLKVLARENCRREVQAYVDCTNTAGLAVVWSCREALGEMNACLGQWTSPEALAETRRQWVEGGRRQDVGWRPDLSRVVGGQP